MTIVIVGIDLAKNVFAVQGGYATDKPCWFATACHAAGCWNSSQCCCRVSSAAAPERHGGRVAGFIDLGLR